MDAVTIGIAGLRGWRAKVGEAVAAPASRRTPLDPDQVRALVGALFFVLSLTYVVGTVRQVLARNGRGPGR